MNKIINDVLELHTIRERNSLLLLFLNLQIIIIGVKFLSVLEASFPYIQHSLTKNYMCHSIGNPCYRILNNKVVYALTVEMIYICLSMALVWSMSNIIRVWTQITISPGLKQVNTKSNSHTFHNILARAGNSIFNMCVCLQSWPTHNIIFMFKTKKPQTIEPRLSINNQTAFIVCLACGIMSSSIKSLSNIFSSSIWIYPETMHWVGVYKIGHILFQNLGIHYRLH